MIAFSWRAKVSIFLDLSMSCVYDRPFSQVLDLMPIFSSSIFFYDCPFLFYKERKIPDEEYKQVIPDLDEYTKVCINVRMRWVITQ